MNLEETLEKFAWESITMREIASFQADLWNQGVTHVIREAYPVQKTITKNVKERGYGPGDLTPAQYAAKQVCKAIEELAELANCFVLPLKLGASIYNTGLVAREAFDNVGVWKRDNDTLSDCLSSYGVREELADTLIPLFVCAEALGLDALAEAVGKSSADVLRGVRNQIAAAPHGAKGGEEE